MEKSPPRLLPRLLMIPVLGSGLLMGMLVADSRASGLASRVSLDTSSKDVREAPLARADMMRTFKARCPGRVERLLGMDLPSERPDFNAIGDICACAVTAIESIKPTPDPVSISDYHAQASQAALGCSKTTITARNERRARKALTPYLVAQGLSADQIGHFSQCAANTHWHHMMNGAREGLTASSLDAWWSVCREQVGLKHLPLPGDGQQ